MSFLDVTFPRQTATELEAEDIDATEIVETNNGAEKRNQPVEFMRRRYDLAAIGRTKAEAQRIYDFWQVVGGRRHSFRLWDYRHNTVTAGNIGTGDGSTLAFQLRSTHTFGGQTAYRDETKPHAGVKVFVNGIEKTETTDFTVDLATGIVTFVVAPAADAVVTSTFTFDVCVRFEQQRLRWRAQNGGSDRLLFFFDALSFIEVVGE